jgi:hypothetical protein
MSTPTQAPAIDMNRLNAFIGQFVTDLGAAVHAGMVVIGEKLGLYKALASGPLSSAQLAAKTKTDERYLREWLASQAAGDTSPTTRLPASSVAGGAYVNFMMEGEGEDRIRATYRNNYARLAQVKAKYDSSNFFRVNQNIRPEAGAKTSGLIWLPAD